MDSDIDRTQICQMEVVPVILSGGAGSRLWPVSRESHPKPFMCMNDGKSLLCKTLERVLQLNNVNQVLTITNRDYYFQTVDEYKKTYAGTRVALEYLLEPVGRNTAPAIIAAALQLVEADCGNVAMLVLPADHLVDPVSSFAAAVSLALTEAANGKLVTFGIRPQKPETGFGYIKKGSINKNFGSYQVDTFVEKPDRKTAKAFLASQQYLWNAGMFCFRPAVLLSEMEKYSPAILNQVRESWELRSSDRPLTLPMESFAKVESLSIDYALMEKSDNVVVVECSFEWNDVGSWDAIYQKMQHDSAGNSSNGECILLDSKNTYISSANRFIAGVGLSDLAIIDTPDALLVVNKNKAQDVKKVFDKLRAKNHDACKYHNTVHRPWGTYTVLEESQRFKIKRLVVKPKAALSLQLHYHRSEHWVVVSGTAEVIIDGETKLIRSNESVFVPCGKKHKLYNPGMVDLVMIEVQSGDYLGEDDIVRIDDRYGRELLLET